MAWQYFDKPKTKVVNSSALLCVCMCVCVCMLVRARESLCRDIATPEPLPTPIRGKCLDVPERRSALVPTELCPSRLPSENDWGLLLPNFC